MQLDLFRFPYSVKRQRHYMGAIEDVLVSTSARYRRDLATIKAHADAANELR